MTALAERLAAVTALDPAAPALEFDGEWWTWGDLDRTASEVARALAETGLGAGAPVGLLLRNRPAALGALLGLLRAEACVVTLSPLLGAERVGRDVVELGLPLVVGERSDLDLLPADPRPAPLALAELGDLGGSIVLTPGAVPAVAAVARGVAVRMLTSGTTGPPKRIDLRYDVLAQVMAGAKHYETGTGSDLRLRDGVVVVNAPLVHVSGVFRVVQAVLDGRRIALLERFTVDGWADAVRRHRPKTVSLVPTALRMVLEADVDDDVFASIRSIVSGTAPLDPDLADAFTDRYAVPVLTSYGATEFGGGVAGWNVADHQQYGAAKRGSVGRAHVGCTLRIVDADSGVVLVPDAVGLLEVRAAELGAADWVRTTDLARLDADGFLWIVGRADQTILRGGFKVQPEVVRAVLEQDPAVAEAAVVGVPDDRLGAVPVAVVERRPGHDVDPEALLVGAAERLAPYERPVRVTVVDALPRVASGKVDLAAVREQLAVADGGLGRMSAEQDAGVEKWVFGEPPLPEVIELAGVLRDLAGTVVSLEHAPPELQELTATLRAAQQRLAALAPPDPTPRIGDGASPDQRVYVDHGRDIGAFNPMFPRYDLESRVDGTAVGTVTFPVCYEGPPGIVHGGVLATFFDCVLQQLNCDLGQAGKTAELTLRFRRPTPLLTPLVVHATRAVQDGRIRSHAELHLGEKVLCECDMAAAVGDRGALPAVSPRRP